MIITETPFRVSFLGGGTDYPEHFHKHGGAVLGTAIDQCAYLTVMRFHAQLFDYNIRLAYRKVECVGKLAEIEHAPFRVILKKVGLESNVEINYAAELPGFSGLGTSSSFVVGLLNALYAYKGEIRSPMALAQEAIEIEREHLGESVGCQDQTFAAFGGVNLIEFRNCGDIVVNRVPLSRERIAEIEASLLMVFTGIKRRASDVAQKQIAKVSDNNERLTKLRHMVDDGYEAMTGGRLENLGNLLHEAWLLKQQLDDGISNSAIGDIYKAGMEAGAWGGKLLGAGGGGFVLFLVPPEKRASIREKLGHLEDIPLRINHPGSRVVHAG